MLSRICIYCAEPVPNHKLLKYVNPSFLTQVRPQTRTLTYTKHALLKTLTQAVHGIDDMAHCNISRCTNGHYRSCSRCR